VKRVEDDQGRSCNSPKIASRSGALTISLEPATKVIAKMRHLFAESILVGWKYELAGTPPEALAKAVRQTPIHRGFDEFWRQESQRYCHVDLADAACGAGRDGLGCGIGVFDKLLEPTAPLRNRCNYRPSRLRANGPPVLPRWVGGQENLATPCWWRLAPGNVEGVGVFGLAAVGSLGLVQFNDQLITPKLNPRHAGIDKAAVVDVLGRFDMVANRLNDQILNLGGRDPAYRSRTLGRGVDRAAAVEFLLYR